MKNTDKSARNRKVEIFIHLLSMNIWQIPTHVGIQQIFIYYIISIPFLSMGIKMLFLTNKKAAGFDASDYPSPSHFLLDHLLLSVVSTTNIDDELRIP
jgi:hypothetical protein